MSKLIEAVVKDEEKIPSLITNPFLGECIGDIHMHSLVSILDKTKRTNYAIIEFKNGNTSGEQRIDGDSLPDVLMKLYEFCKSFEK